MWNVYPIRWITWIWRNWKNRKYTSLLRHSMKERYADLAIPLTLEDDYQAVLRLATFDEGKEIYEVEKDAYLGESPWSLRSFQQDLRANVQSMYLVIEYKNEIIAFLGARKKEDSLHISNIAVKRDYRYLGCAQHLLTALKQIARSEQEKKLTLEVRISNTRAIRLYHKMGFEKQEIVPQYYLPEREDALCMSYRLTEELPASFHSNEYLFKKVEKLSIEEATCFYQMMEMTYVDEPSWKANDLVLEVEQASTGIYTVLWREQFVGFAHFQQILDEATLLNIAIHPHYQQQGLAKRLWQFVVYDLQERGISTIFLEVREHNHVARTFYEKVGFKEYSQRKAYYHHPQENAILYRWDASSQENRLSGGN